MNKLWGSMCIYWVGKIMQILSITHLHSWCCFPAYYRVFVTGFAALSLPLLSHPDPQLLHLLGKQLARLDLEQAAQCLPPTFTLLRAVTFVPTSLLCPAQRWTPLARTANSIRRNPISSSICFAQGWRGWTDHHTNGTSQPESWHRGPEFHFAEGVRLYGAAATGTHAEMMKTVFWTVLQALGLCSVP